MGDSETSTKDWYMTFGLCVLFVGIFGAHQFYLGRWKIGVLYLWLWPIFLFTLWPRDIYYLWTGKMKDADGNKLHSYKSWQKNINEKFEDKAKYKAEELVKKIKAKRKAEESPEESESEKEKEFHHDNRDL